MASPSSDYEGMCFSRRSIGRFWMLFSLCLGTGLALACTSETSGPGSEGSVSLTGGNSGTGADSGLGTGATPGAGGTTGTGAAPGTGGTPASGTGGADLGPEVSVLIEEADGFCRVDGTIDTDNAGFSGDGFANADNAVGAGIEWSVTAVGPTPVSLEWLYANGGAVTRPASVVVNGTVVATLDFPVTGDWSTWDTAKQTVDLVAGENTIRLEATTAEGLANIDSLNIVGPGVSVRSCETDPGVDPDPGGPPLAFPGAEGFGRWTSGGRGGEVYHVTNLNDSGAGSFRDAVSQPNRIVVFDVGGVINISTRIVIKRNVYVAGQTAPGGGITIYGNGIALNGDSGNNIIRYIRVRMGKNGDSGKDAVAISAGQDYIFDHVSISWGRDGTLDVNGSGIDNLTFQETIVSQGINNSNHSTGGLMQSGKWSMIRSLYIDNKTRNPKARGTHEFINSVLYNWATNGYIMGDTSGVSECNLVGNYFIYGPSSSSGSHITNTTPTFYVYGDDNWVDSNKNGVLDGSLMTDYKTATVVATPFNYPAGVAGKLSAEQALEHVLDNVGASLVRDAVDELLIDQVRSYGTAGQIINTEDDNMIAGNVGTVANGTPPADTDRDGMPDGWESTRGLDPNTPDDGGDDDGDGYTNIEEYLSCLVGEGDC